MDGTALYQSIAAVFIAQAVGFPLDLYDQLSIMVMTIIASIGTAAVPSAGIVMLIIILDSLCPSVDTPSILVLSILNKTPCIAGFNSSLETDVFVKSNDNDNIVVDCKFDPLNSSIPAGNVGLNGSPLYPNYYVGDINVGLKHGPSGYMSDDNNSSLYFGELFTDLIKGLT